MLSRMNVNNWNLITIDATKLLYNLTERNLIQHNGDYMVNFRYDISGQNALDRHIISSENRVDDNALFFQLRKVLKADDSENCMRSSIIFMDFKEVFDTSESITIPVNQTPAKKLLLSDEGLNYRLKQLFEDGLYLKFDAENYRHFVPFDKSNSMAKKCQITFIDSQIKAELDRRLMLDMNFIGQDLPLSKFYAYRGLYLSQAFRIGVDNTKKFSLNEETVIVLDDCRNSLRQNVFTAKRSDPQGIWEYETSEKELRLNVFDGEGLIAPDFAEYLSNFLIVNYNLSSPSHSFQIRLPFTKGVLHEVDFNKFFSEQLNQENGALLIKDMFGVTRDLRKAKIILTRSMLKCGDWIKKLDIKSLGSDPMKYFFQKIAEYDHALYVTNTEARLTNPGYIKLNHQFLSTLALTSEDFDSFIAEQRQRINSFDEKFKATLANPIDTQETEDSYEDEYDYSLRKDMARKSCLKVASKNPAFLRDPKVKSIYDEMLKNYACALGLGKFEVEGEQRFFSCDLLYLLIKILSNIENVSISNSQKNLLKKQCLTSKYFFMPKNKIPIKANAKYVFLRNPHLSRNEQVLLSAYSEPNSLYEKYFSHLKGAVMISANSSAAMSLGGADYDGDIVKIIVDSRIIQAVQIGNCNAKLPPIQIPASKPIWLPLGDTIPFSVIVDTFSSKVGQISNLAVKFAEKEYFSKPVNAEYENACAKCTIVVGLEIDAAKTGNHPTQNIQELESLIKTEKNTFLYTKEKVIGTILKYHYDPVVDRRDNTFSLYFTKDNRDKGISNFNVTFEGDDAAPLKRLPEEFLRLVFDKISPVLKPPAPSPYFNFEVPSWRSELDKNIRAELQKLIKAYLHILNLDHQTRRVKNYLNKTDFSGRIINILKLQYDDLYQKLPCGVEIKDALDQLYAELLFILKTEAASKEACNKIKSKKWHLVPEKDRPAVAAEILGCDSSAAENFPAIFELLYNFRCNGFMLFYYVLVNLESSLFDEKEFIEKKFIDDFNDNKSNDNKSKVSQNPYYEELYKVYSTSIAEKKSKAIWNSQLKILCRKFLAEIFDNDFTTALKYYWSSHSADSSRNFLWNIFNEQEIFSQVYIPEVQD